MADSILLGLPIFYGLPIYQAPVVMGLGCYTTPIHVMGKWINEWNGLTSQKQYAHAFDIRAKIKHFVTSKLILKK